MRCYFHPEAEGVGACVNCGRAVCADCKVEVGGKLYCRPCAEQIFIKGPLPAKRSGKLTAGGVLSIISGAAGIIPGIILLALPDIFLSFLQTPPPDSIPMTPEISGILRGAFIAGGISSLALGGVAVAGGIAALQRRRFGLALAGGICAILSLFFLGIPALILIAQSRGEFE